MTFPTHIDNTIRENFVICPTKARRAYIEDLAPTMPSVHLHFGGAAAAGYEAGRRAYYEQHKTPAEAIEAAVVAAETFYGDFDPPAGSYKTKEAVGRLMRFYFGRAFPFSEDTYRPKRMEWRFAVPIPGLVHPDTQGPIYYCGRPDTIGDVGSVEVVEDDKTAGSLGNQWLKQWELDSQFTGYQWAAQQEGLIEPGGMGGVLIRGASILKPKFDEVETTADDPLATSTKTAGRAPNKVTKYFREEYNEAGSFGSAQVLVYRPQWQIDRWLRQIQRDIGRMITAYLNDEWDYALHKGACGAYGGCNFTLLCGSEHPEQWEPVHFVKRKWDPMAVV